MADLLAVQWVVMLGFFFAGWAVLLVTSFSMAAARTTDRGVAQLRLFKNYGKLSRGMLLLGIGSVGGFLGSTPWLILILLSGGTQAPIALTFWTLGWTILWAAGVCGGFLRLTRVFSLREVKGE